MPNSGKTRYFDVPAEQLGAAHSWVDHGERTPRAARFASSVVLLRESPAGIETFLGYRRGDSPLGKVAFPGGSLEENDGDELPWFGPSPAHWSRMLGMSDHALARRHVLGAIRELFEETGVLLAGPDPMSLAEGGGREEWMQARQLIAEEEESFAHMLARRGLGLRTDLLRPLSRWITQDFAHRRFDTRYFAAVQPLGQAPSLLADKGIWAAWCRAGEVLAERDSSWLGDRIGQPDTVGVPFSQLAVPAVQVIVEGLAMARGCIAFLAHKRPPLTFQPQLEEVGGRFVLSVRMPLSTEGVALRRR